MHLTCQAAIVLRALGSEISICQQTREAQSDRRHAHVRAGPGTQALRTPRPSDRRSSSSATVKCHRQSSSESGLRLWRFYVLLKRPLASKLHPHERLVDYPIHRKIV